MKISGRLSVLSIFFSVAFWCVSCSGQLFTASQEETGLRAKINSQYKQLEWTEELAPEGLQKPELQKKIIDSPVFLSVTESANTVFPQLEGFGSLDNSILPRALLRKLDAFFAALPEIAEPDFLNPERQYLPVFLKYTFSSSVFKIKRWVYGKPIVSNSVYEIPIRFYGEKMYMDVLVFVNTGKSFFLDQIQVGDIHHE